MKKSGLRILTVGIILLIAGCVSAPERSWPGETWERSTPEAQGMDSEILLKMLKTVNPERLNIHSMVIIRNGRLVTEFYREPYEKEMLHEIYSSTKSFTSTLIGIAIDQGLIGSVKDSVFKYLPEYKPDDPLMAEMTIEDLLTMRSGVYWNDYKFYSTNAMMNGNDDWLHYFFSLAMDSAPGEEFVYNSGNSHALAEILNRVTDGNARQFAEEYLLTPLGITDYVWSEAPGGCIVGLNGLSLRTEDLARLGYLFLNDGYWNGRKILSAGWVKKAIQIHADFRNLPLGSAAYGYEGYGYQWWIFRNGIYATMGYGGQFCFVYPEQNLIAAMNASINVNQEGSIITMVGLGIQRAAVSSGTLQENPEAEESLNEYLSSISKAQQTGPFADTGIINKLTGHTIRFSENPAGLKSLSFSNGDNDELICELVNNIPEELEGSPNEVESTYKIKFAIGLDGEYRYAEIKLPGYGYIFPDKKYIVCARAVKISSDTFIYNFTIPATADYNITDTITLKDNTVSLIRSSPGYYGLQNSRSEGVIE